MAELKCGAESCVYNKEHLCSKGDIMVGGRHADSMEGTCCESYIIKKMDKDAYTSSISHPSNIISIDCEAVKCVYNHNYKCIAEHVDIQGTHATDSRETACATFTEK